MVHQPRPYQLKEQEERTEIREDLNKQSERWEGNGEVICDHFGCANKLTITEQLYGSRCISCSGEEKTIKNYKG